MIRDIRRRYFEIWGTEEAQNSFLKGAIVVLSVLFAAQSIVVTVLALKKPVLVAVSGAETKVLAVAPPSDELLSSELKRVVRSYVETHYTWDSSSIEKSHAEASRYVGQAFVKAFNSANAEQIRIAKEKKVSQKVYVSEITIDLKKLTTRVAMDRILMIEGLRATNPFNLEITFEYGPRTPTNPEGVYVTGEKNLTIQDGR